MKKKSNVLAWIRKVRDENYRQDKGLTAEEKIARTRAAARAFEKSRATNRASTKRK